MTVVIVDYGSGNLRSAAKAFERAVDEAQLKISVIVTSNPADLKAASHIVLPGVGAFADCRNGLARLDGMEIALKEHVQEKKTPFLGICVGMQLMATIGRENGDTQGLNWLPGEVVAMAPAQPNLKIPHMGWNNLTINIAQHPVLEGIEGDDHFYFVHSYVYQPTVPSDIIATTDHGGPVVAMIGRDNLIGTQFHPEKSQDKGLRLISNFIKWHL